MLNSFFHFSRDKIIEINHNLNNITSSFFVIMMKEILFLKTTVSNALLLLPEIKYSLMRYKVFLKAFMLLTASYFD
jgi:hypothetical protein